MTDGELLPDNLTATEKDMGFARTEVDNPRAYLAGQPSKTWAVVCEVNEHNRVIKTRMPTTGEIRYAPQRFGRRWWETPAQAQWHVADDNYADPSRAIAETRAKVDQPCKVSIISPDPDKA